MLTAVLAIVVCSFTFVLIRVFGLLTSLRKLHVAYTSHLYPIASMGEEIVIPQPEEQKDILSRILAKSIVSGETWYLISAKWLKSLKQFIGIPPNGGYICQPGPIDNQPILTDDLKDLRKGLAENYDYDLISAECWNLLASWYGTIPDQVPIARKAVLSGKNYSMVEVYLIELKCCKNFENDTENKIKVSKADLMSTVHDKLRKQYKVPDHVPSRLCMSYGEDKFQMLNLDVTVQDSGLVDSQLIVLDTQINGAWRLLGNSTANEPSSSYSPYLSQPSTSRNNYVNNATSISLRSTRNNASLLCSNPLWLPGVCGLNNLGFTCFMNSVIQCLSNSPPLTEYFLNNLHLKELNITNPLGMKGEIAKAYGELIQTMWSGRVHATSPVQFKIQVAKFNVQFYQNEHDAQELLTFLLDGMHEDLNRITKKPYIENKDYSGQEDYVIAKESWENYRKRNDSIVVDTFHGLLKSRVVCPQCERLSVTFDPFCTLSLPLPLKKERYMKIRYIPYDPSERECLYRVLVPRRGFVKDLCKEVGMKTNTNPLNLITAEINNSHFHKFYSHEEGLENIDDKDVIYIYEMTEQVNDPGLMIVPVCFWELCKPNDKFSQNHLFGVPFLSVLPKDDLNLNQIVKGITFHMGRHFKLPDSLCYNSDLRDLPNSNTIYKPNLYLFDTGDFYRNPKKLDFDENGECIEDLGELLEVNNFERVFGRKIFIVQLSVEERRDYFCEQPADYGSDLNISRSNTKDKGKIQLYDCLDLFTTCEKLGEQNAWYCSKCKKHQRATKKFDLWKLPKVLIVHLKRFSYFRAGDKIDAFVKYPINNLDLNKYVINPEQRNISYDLIGVINHYGTMSAGHYTAYCKNKESNTWYYFNDDSVAPINVDELLGPSAYLLFYYRNDSVNPPDTPMDLN